MAEVMGVTSLERQYSVLPQPFLPYFCCVFREEKMMIDKMILLAALCSSMFPFSFLNFPNSQYGLAIYIL